MPEVIEISGIDYSQGLPTPDGTGDLGQTDSPPSFAIVAIGAILTSVLIGGTMGAMFGRLFSGKWSWESTARGAVIGGMITTFRAVRIGTSGRKDISMLEVVI